MLQMLLFADLFVCIYERRNAAEMEKLIINLIFELDDKTNDKMLLNTQKRIHLRKKKRNLLLKELLMRRRRIPKVLDYFSIIKGYPEDVFFDHFRMSLSTFQALKRELKPFWHRFGIGRLGINLEQSLYITLWKLSNSGVTFRQLSDRFNVARGTVHKMFYKTVRAICHLKKQIAWPSALQQQTVMERMQNSREAPFPFVIGCLDGTHFKIPKPKIDPISYYNRKGFYSINMQAICDSKFRFLDVFIGYPGSCHDADVWNSSPIYKSIVTGKIQLAQNAVILGDSAYPISKFLLTPYRDNGYLTREQKKFNFCLSSTRVMIEQAFGILKNKFKILDRLDTESLKNVSDIVLACTILHNFIINNGQQSEYVASSIPTAEDDNGQNNESTASEDEDGIAMRNYLTTLFSS